MKWFKKEDGKINWMKVAGAIVFPVVALLLIVITMGSKDKQEAIVEAKTEEIIGHVADEPSCDLKDLDGKKIWDLYKMDDGQYMLQTEDSEYYADNASYKEVTYKCVNEEEA